MQKSFSLFGATVLLLAGAAGALAAPMPLDVTDGGKKMMGDPGHGKTIFNRCMVCHSIDKQLDQQKMSETVGRKGHFVTIGAVRCRPIVSATGIAQERF